MIDMYVNPAGEDLGKVRSQIEKVIGSNEGTGEVHIDIRGMVEAMRNPSGASPSVSRCRWSCCT